MDPCNQEVFVLEGWANLAYAICMEAQYQQFNAKLLSRADDDEQRERWREQMSIGSEKHRASHLDLMRFLSAGTVTVTKI